MRYAFETLSIVFLRVSNTVYSEASEEPITNVDGFDEHLIKRFRKNIISYEINAYFE